MTGLPRKWNFMVTNTFFIFVLSVDLIFCGVISMTSNNPLAFQCQLLVTVVMAYHDLTSKTLMYSSLAVVHSETAACSSYSH